MSKRINTRKYMKRGYELHRAIEIKKEQVASIRAFLYDATVSLDEEHVSKTCNVSSMGDSVVQIIQLEEEIKKDMTQLAIIQRETAAIINRLDNMTMRSVLTKYYVCFKSWDTIRAEMHISRKYGFNVHAAALTQIDAILNPSCRGTPKGEVTANE